MSELNIYDAAEGVVRSRTNQTEKIAKKLSHIGAVFAQYELPQEPQDFEETQDETLETHRELLNDLMLGHGFASIDVLSVPLGYPRLEKLTKTFATEHHHPEHQGVLLLAGGGRFHFRYGEQLLCLQCEPGDFINLPAKVNHWFEMDQERPFCAIRLFASIDGWVAIPASEKIPVEDGPQRRARQAI